VAEPSRNVTVPLADDGEMLAVKVTLAPTADVLPDEVTDIVVGALSTRTVTAEELPGASKESPP
jgi:hypothetical protein